MQAFRIHVSSLLCCLGAPQQDDDGEHRPSILRTLQKPASALSISLPHTTVPHGSSESNSNDAQALREIFSSSSSVRGYQTAATSPGYHPNRGSSFDANFQFGIKTPVKRPVGRIEQLGHHIKQKLSESGLSRASSKQDVKPENDGYQKVVTSSSVSDDHTIPPGQINDRATGLTELLTSRSTSEGGYDSDAVSIKTPVLASNTGTIRISPHTVKKLSAAAVNHVDTKANLPPVVTIDAPNDEKIAAASTHDRAKSSPFPSSPSKVSFTAALQIEANESPTDALRRLSAGIANGTIKMPGTPELRAMRMPSMNTVENEWQLAAPSQTSSHVRQDQQIPLAMERLSSRIETAKRESFTPNVVDGKRTSIISDLDPALLDFMAKYADRKVPECVDKMPLPAPVQDLNAKKQDLSKPSSHSLALEGKAESDSGGDVRSLAETENDSIHLFNMRISQRLASSSMIPVLSPSNSHHASSRSLVLNTTGTLSIPNRNSYTRQPNRIASEHNRRPSDPQTRRLFESEASEGKLYRQWKTVTSVHSSINSPVVNTKNLVACVDDFSSFYWSDGEIPESHVASPSNVTRRSSLKNANSLAIRGRSVSAGFPSRYTNGSIGQLSTAGESTWFRGKSKELERTSEDSWAPTERPITKDQNIVAPQMKLDGPPKQPDFFGRRLQQATEAAEDMSLISVERVVDRRNEGMSEVNTQALPLRKSTFVPKVLGPSPSLSTECHRLSAGWLSQGKRAGYGFDFVNPSETQPVLGRSPSWINLPLKRTSLGANEESASSIWGRAFQRAKEVPSREHMGGFLTAPRFDRNGKRTRVRTTLSESGSPIGRHQLSHSPLESRRSRSAERPPFEFFQLDIDDHQRLCSAAKAPLPTVVPRIIVAETGDAGRRSKSLKDKKRLNRKSILDLGRRFTTVGVPSDDEKSAEPSTPIKDLLSVWARFASHSRLERNAAANGRDGVMVKDFICGAPNENSAPTALRYSTPLNASAVTVDSCTPGSWRFLTWSIHKRLDKVRSKSMTLRSTPASNLSRAERARRNRKGLGGRWRKLYRNSSTDMREYAFTHGHRSSISIGDDVEYPELECLPGEGMFKVAHFQPDFTSHNRFMADAVSNPGLSSPAMPKPKGDVLKPDAAEWAKHYEDCVGSLSALRSDTDVMSTTGSGGICDHELKYESNGIRGEPVQEIDKTVQQDDEKDGQDVNKAVADPEKMDDTVMSAELKMPGSFA